jgi:RecA-family ATPase
VVFDTFSKIHLADENSNSQMTPVMMRLLDLCYQNNLTILLIHHVNKNKEATGLSRGRGASCIADNVSSYLEITSRKIKSALTDEDFIQMQVSQKKSRRR